MSVQTPLSAASTALLVAATVVCSFAATSRLGDNDNARNQTCQTSESRRATVAGLRKKVSVAYCDISTLRAINVYTAAR